MFERLLTYRRSFVFVFALSLHLAMFWTFAGRSYTERFGTDAGQYKTMATNILAGRGFSLRTMEPYVPDSIRTPVYPMYLAASKALTGSFYPTIYLSILLAATIPLAGMGIMRLLKPSARLELAAGLLLSFDPHLWYYGMIYGSEAVFLPLVAWGLFLTFRMVRSPSGYRAAAAGAVMGLATLTRPIVQFVPALVVLVAVSAYLRKQSLAKVLVRSALIFICGWGLVVAPWLWRNHALFGSWSFANIGWFNMYTRVAATVESIETKRPYNDLRLEYLQRLHDKGYVATSPVEEWDVHGYEFKPIFQKETLEAIRRYPKSFAISQVSSFLTVISQDVAMPMAKRLGIVKYRYPSFSPVVTLVRDGPFALVHAFTTEFSWPFLYALVARVFWLLLFLASLAAPWLAWRYRKDLVMPAIFLVLYDLGIVALSLNAAAQADARYRAQFIFVQVPLALLTYALWKHRTEPGAPDQVKVPMAGPACPACGCASLSRVRGRIDGFVVSGCGVCGTQTVVSPPPVEILRDVYGEGYFDGGGVFGYVDYEADKRAATGHLEGVLDILGTHAAPGRLLDVGAATGVFMEHAARRGWRPVGHEISEAAAAKARAKGHVVTTGDLAGAGHELATFDAVTMLDVLEHVSDPAAMLTQAADLLVPGGILLVNTPDASSVYATFMGLRWHAFVPPEHLVLLTPRAMRLMLERQGFSVLWIGRVPKAFRLSYVLRTVARRTRWGFVNKVADVVAVRPSIDLHLPLDLRDNMVIVARRPA
jgi:SAM-dependent methyltransferase